MDSGLLPPGSPPSFQHSWAVSILGQLEETSLFDRFMDRITNKTVNGGYAGSTPGNNIPISSY